MIEGIKFLLSRFTLLQYLGIICSIIVAMSCMAIIIKGMLKRECGKSFSAGGANGAQQLINLLTAKTAKDLSLDLNINKSK